MQSGLILADCGVKWQRKCRGKCSPLSSGSGFSLVSVPSAAVLSCRADKMWHQMKPNKTHSSQVWSSFSEATAVSSSLWQGHAGRVSKGKKNRTCLWVLKQNKWSVYHSVYLTLKVTEKSDKMWMTLSNSDVFIESLRLLLLCINHEKERYVSTVSLGFNRWVTYIPKVVAASWFCEFDHFLTLTV